MSTGKLLKEEETEQRDGGIAEVKTDESGVSQKQSNDSSTLIYSLFRD